MRRPWRARKGGGRGVVGGPFRGPSPCAAGTERARRCPGAAPGTALRCPSRRCTRSRHRLRCSAAACTAFTERRAGGPAAAVGLGAAGRRGEWPRGQMAARGSSTGRSDAETRPGPCRAAATRKALAAGSDGVGRRTAAQKSGPSGTCGRGRLGLMGGGGVVKWPNRLSVLPPRLSLTLCSVLIAQNNLALLREISHHLPSLPLPSPLPPSLPPSPSLPLSHAPLFLSIPSLSFCPYSLLFLSLARSLTLALSRSESPSLSFLLSLLILPLLCYLFSRYRSRSLSLLTLCISRSSLFSLLFSFSLLISNTHTLSSPFALPTSLISQRTF